jgi:hypothetical protein
MRSIQLKSIAIAAVCCVQFIGWHPAFAQNRENELENFKARWQLRFFPQELPDVEKLINGTMWSRSSSSRDGAGGSRTIVFAEKTGEARSIRRLTLSILKQDTSLDESLRGKRLMAGWDNQTLERILCGFRGS